MTDHPDTVAALADAFVAVRRDPSINVHDFASALLAQITPAFVAEAVAKEQEECAKVADAQAIADDKYAAKYSDERQKYESRAHRARTIAAAIRNRKETP